MDDALEHVGVRSLGYRCEEIASNHIAAIEHARRLQTVRIRDHLGLVVEDALNGRMDAEDVREEPATPTTDIDNAAKLAEIICARDDAVLFVGKAGHPAIKAHLSLWMRTEVIEVARAMHMREGWLAGLDAVQQIGIGVPVCLVHHAHSIPQSTGLKERSGGRQCEVAVAVLGKYPVARQHSQEPIE